MDLLHECRPSPDKETVDEGGYRSNEHFIAGLYSSITRKAWMKALRRNGIAFSVPLAIREVGVPVLRGSTGSRGYLYYA